MTRDQLGACIALQQGGMIPVDLSSKLDMATMPVPGLQLFVNAWQTKLLLVQPDGTVVDLLAVHRTAEDCVRNWGKDRSMPNYIGDWPRLTALATELNGRKP